MMNDPQEDDPILGPLIRAAGEAAVEELRSEGYEERMGFCHLIWGRQQEILKAKHGIDWRSPDEMNPEVLFD